jgi:hypothetical protein
MRLAETEPAATISHRSRQAKARRRTSRDCLAARAACPDCEAVIASAAKQSAAIMLNFVSNFTQINFVFS